MKTSHHICQINNLRDLRVCKDQKCLKPNLICKKCFQTQHLCQKGNKTYIHDNVGLEQFGNIIAPMNRLSSLEKLLEEQTKKIFYNFKTNFQKCAQVLLCESQYFNQKFQGVKNAKLQYKNLREIIQGSKVNLNTPFSNNFLEALFNINEREITEIKKALLQEPIQYQFMKTQINYFTNLSSKKFQQFIQQQQKSFSKYCHKIHKNGESFSIEVYLQKHKKQDSIDPIYYCTSFEQFLVDKYRSQKNQNIFTITQYFNDFWKYFPYIFTGHKSARIKQYYTHIINYYNEYSRIMKETCIPQSLYNFILWLQINYCTSNFLQKLQNHYFYNLYIYSFIQLLLQVKKLGNHEINQGQWEKYYEYLVDFQSITTQIFQNTVLNFTQYGAYYIFRKQKEEFVQKLKCSPDVIFNRKIVLNYLNQCYESGAMPNKKKYVQYQQIKQYEEQQKSKLIALRIHNLKQTVQQEQKQQFYQYIFENFIDCIHQNKLPITIEQYNIYKAKFLEQVDLDFIKEQEEVIKQHNSLNSQELMRKELFSMQIDSSEEQLHRQFDESEHQSEVYAMCDCCHGKPYDCQNQQCLQMGCCLCSFS